MFKMNAENYQENAHGSFYFLIVLNFALKSERPILSAK